MTARSYAKDSLPEEVTLPLVRRAEAEQNRHMNLARIAVALESIASELVEIKRTRQHAEHRAAWVNVPKESKWARLLRLVGFSK